MSEVYTTPRVPMLSEDEAKALGKEHGVNSMMATLSVFRIMLRRPKVAKAMNDMLVSLLFTGKLDARLRELIIMRIGWVTGSCYEWTQHWRVSKQLSIPDDVILAVRDWTNAGNLTDADKAVLAATDDVLERGLISDATWDLCKQHVPGGDEGLIDMVAAIGNWSLFSNLLKSLHVPLEEGTEPWPPDGDTP